MDELLELMSVDEWKGLQRYFSAVTGITSVTFNLEGKPLFAPEFMNEFCPIVKSKALGKIACQDSHLAIAKIAIYTKNPVIDRCHAGLIKVVVPITFEDRMIGVTGGCGVLMDQETPDSQTIRNLSMMLNHDADDLAEKAKTIAKVSDATLNMEIDMIKKLISEKAKHRLSRS